MNPYTRLQRLCMTWAHSVVHPWRKLMWIYPKDKIASVNWSLRDLQERVQAASDLGFDVTIKPTPDGLEVWYVKRPEDPPWEIR